MLPFVEIFSHSRLSFMNNFAKLFDRVFGFTSALIVASCAVCHVGHCNTRFDALRLRVELAAGTG